MLTLNDFKNSISNNNLSLGINKPEERLTATNLNNSKINNDTFESSKNINITTNKSKSKYIKVGTAILTAIVAAVAIVKRKAIGEFLSNLKKKPQTPPIQTDIPNKPVEIPQVEPKATKPITQVLENTSQDIKYELPKPNFGINPTREEQQAYIDSIAQYLKPNDMGDMTDQALDALAKYGTGEDLKKIHGMVWMDADEARTKKIIQTVGAIGRKDVDSYHLALYISGVHNHTNDTYVELFKATKKLFPNFYERGCNFEDLMRFANRIPTDETGEYTKEYIDMLISVGRKEDIEFLNKYLRNYNHINEFIENKQQTPQVIVDAIEKARQGILAKH